MSDITLSEFLTKVSYSISEETFDVATKKWGCKSRKEMVVEECSELILAIMHSWRNSKSGTNEEVREESIDVLITVLALLRTLNFGDSIEILNKKTTKFKSRVNNNNKEDL